LEEKPRKNKGKGRKKRPTNRKLRDQRRPLIRRSCRLAQVSKSVFDAWQRYQYSQRSPRIVRERRRGKSLRQSSVEKDLSLQDKRNSREPRTIKEGKGNQKARKKKKKIFDKGRKARTTAGTYLGHQKRKALLSSS